MIDTAKAVRGADSKGYRGGVPEHDGLAMKYTREFLDDPQMIENSKINNLPESRYRNFFGNRDISVTIQTSLKFDFDVLNDSNSPYKNWDPFVSFGVGVGF